MREEGFEILRPQLTPTAETVGVLGEPVGLPLFNLHGILERSRLEVPDGLRHDDDGPVDLVYRRASPYREADGAHGPFDGKLECFEHRRHVYLVGMTRRPG